MGTQKNRLVLQVTDNQTYIVKSQKENKYPESKGNKFKHILMQMSFMKVALSYNR